MFWPLAISVRISCPSYFLVVAGSDMPFSYLHFIIFITIWKFFCDLTLQVAFQVCWSGGLKAEFV